MQSAPRIARTALRTLPRAQAQPSFSATPSSPSSSRYAPYTPSTRFPTSFERGFASSSRQLAKEADQNPFEDNKQHGEHAPLFERIAQFPEVMDAIEHMAKLTAQKTGVDLQNGGKPSLTMMMSLARDPELRAAAENLMKALKAAGVELDPKQAFQALQMLGEGFGSGSLDQLHEKIRKGEGNGEGEKK